MENTRHLIQTYLIENRVNHSEIAQRLLTNQDIFSRGNLFAHVTASALILDSSGERILLIHHKSLDRWLMPGGHIDEGETPSKAAYREAMEETGIQALTPLSDTFFDVDIHPIPESTRKNEPEHWHVDLRYAFIAPENPELKMAEDEVSGYRWMEIDNMGRLGPSFLRIQQFLKRSSAENTFA